ncbi:MAG: amidohydrolase family protein [Rubripirellula sp.]
MPPRNNLAAGLAATLLCLSSTLAGDVAKLSIGEKHAGFHVSHRLSERHEQIEHAVVVVHGTLRNPDSYFDRILRAAELSKSDGKTLIVAPGFHTVDEVEEGEYFWSSGGWKQGDLAQNGRGETKVSSFDVIDLLIKKIVDERKFPQLKNLSIVGHSAGGQFVNRYASAADLSGCGDVNVKFVVMNPSSYMYLDDRRPSENGFRSSEELSDRFPDYDQFRYGVTELNTAMRRIGLNQIKENIATRRCFYFGGTEDTKDKYLDMSPGAMAQGRNRFTRFEGYRRYVAAYQDKRWRDNSKFTAIEAVGHSSTQMLATEKVRRVLFNEVAQSGVSWSKDLLQEARDFSKTLDTAAVVILQHGEVVDQWGATAMPLNCHSIRKSILSALYGPHVANGAIDLDATLQQLGINDNEPSLTGEEQTATIRDLLKARSGVFHPALYETASMAAKRPKRGAHSPNTFWYYNNWDFNAACSIFENLSGRSIFEDFETRIAQPLGMRDFRRDRDTQYVTGADSVHPAYPFQLSTRDLAQFGQLMLQNGRWGNQQLIPEAWVKESTTSYSDAGQSGGYGYMWWIAADGSHFPGVTLPGGSFSARGYRGQYLVVIPDRDLVVCHRVNSFQKGTSVGKSDFGKLLALILDACPDAQRSSPSAATENLNQPIDSQNDRLQADIVIRGGHVIDGTGGKRIRADVAVRNGRIVKIGEIADIDAKRILDATGKLVCPGFIDLHSHAEKGLTSTDPARRSAPNLITQGITTVVVNQDGGGPLDLKQQRHAMQRLGIGMNVIQTLGHGTIRREVMGTDHQRPASPNEIAKMQTLLRSAMKSGAFGMSAGLEYVPGRWSTPREMQSLASTVAEFDGVYIVHERSSGSRPMWFLPSRDAADQPSMLDNLRELVLIADITKVTTVATHIKARGTDFWGSSDAMNALIKRARDKGLRFYADQYPYNTSGTDGRIVLIPGWATATDKTEPDSDAPTDYAARLKRTLGDESNSAKLRQDIDYEITRRGGATSILILEHPDKNIVGKSLADLAASMKATPVEAAIKLQLEGDSTRPGGCRLRAFSMSEADVEAFAKTPWTATSSDARIALPSDGPVHPRFYGAFPRKIRHYAIDRELLTIEEAVRVSTSLPAEILRLKDRGVVREGAFADIVIFDPLRIRDKADAFNPHQFSEGIESVLVNGKQTVADEQWLGNLVGKVLNLQEDTQPNDSASQP